MPYSKKKCAATEAIETSSKPVKIDRLVPGKKKCAATEAIETFNLNERHFIWGCKKKCAATEAIETVDPDVRALPNVHQESRLRRLITRSAL